MNNISSLIGRPWALPCNPPETFDCWELAVSVRRILGKQTPEYKVPPKKRANRDRSDFETPDEKIWKRLDKPQQGCLVGFGNPNNHVGVYHDGRVIHSHSIDGVVGSVQVHRLEVLERFLGEPSYWEKRNAKD